VRRLSLLAGLVSVVAAILAATAAAAAPPKLVEAGKAVFPERAYVLTLPQRTELPGGVGVTENGQPVERLSVTPAGAAGQKGFGTILVVDASNSMKGRPIAGAIAAARAFAARRNQNQKLAVMTFNSGTTLIAPFTTDGAAINQALSRPPALAEGTHIYDAVDHAADLIDRAGLKVGTIVLLSDGADVGSKLSAASVNSKLNDRHLRVFSVGLKSGAYNSTTLQGLAEATDGGYSVASSSKALAGIYDALGYELANEYLISYLSLAGPSRKVAVRVRVPGYQTTLASGYTSPALQHTTASPEHKSVIDKTLQSGITMVLVALLVIVLLGLGVAAVLHKPKYSVQERLSEFVTITPEDERKRREEVLDELRRREGALEQNRTWRSFVDEVELADITMSPGRLVLWTVLAGALLAILVALIVKSPLGLLVFFIAPICTRSYVRTKLKRKRDAFSDQLADNLEVLASALRAGHSLVGALSVVVDDAPEPSRSEFRRVIADEQLGIPLDQALAVTVTRMANRDLDQVALVANLQRDAGGNSAEVIDQVVVNIRTRQELRRLIQTLTAQGRMARWIVTFLPIFLLIAISALNPSYVRPLFHDPAGQFALVLACIMLVTGSLILRKIVDIKV